MAERSGRDNSPFPEESLIKPEVGFKSDIVQNTPMFMDHLSKIMNVTSQSNMTIVSQKVREELQQREKALLAIKQSEEYIDQVTKQKK